MLAPELIRIQEKPAANWVTPAKVNAIRGEFMRQCDKLDGLADGIINNYMACRAIFDVKQGKSEPQSVGGQALPQQCGPESGGHQRQMHASPTARSPRWSSSTAAIRFATPLANGVKTFGMWLPNTDPGGSGLIADARFAVRKEPTRTRAMHTCSAFSGYRIPDERSLGEPARLCRRRQVAARRAELSAMARCDQSRSVRVPEARRQDDRRRSAATTRWRLRERSSTTTSRCSTKWGGRRSMASPDST